MKNIKELSRKFHIIFGAIFSMALLWSSVTAVLFVVLEDFFHKEALAQSVLKFHTLEVIGLKDVYPFIFLIGVIALIITALIMRRKDK